jgi:predicted CDP-diglyceride synthetase/phosphatidate cytidylyltransferase
VFVDNGLLWIIIVVIILLLAIVGDLFESKMKRLYGIKDSGTIVYGHGGILLEHHKTLSFHLDIQGLDRFFWFTNGVV